MEPRHSGLHKFCLFLNTAFLVLMVVNKNILHISAASGYDDYPQGSLACKVHNSTVLDCSCRNLTQVPVLPTNITTISLQSNRINVISPFVFSKQKYLKDISLNFNALPNITGSPFLDLDLLECLEFHSNNISYLSSSVFRGLTSLRALVLSENKLKTIPNDIFNTLSNVYFLNLSLNRLKEIPSEALAPLASLEVLDIDFNYYSSLALGPGFQNLTKLAWLQIHSRATRLSPITNATFQYLTNLAYFKELYFTWDDYEVTVEKGAFVPLKNLEILQTFYTAFEALPLIDNTRMTYFDLRLKPPGQILKRSTLQPLSKWSSTLTTLRMGQTQIRAIEDGAFSWFPNVQRLDLTFMFFSLTTISDNAFEGLYNLEELLLGSNKINTLSPSVFKPFNHTGSLLVLDLSKNSLTGDFEHDTFAYISSLTYLNLGHNPITVIGEWIHALVNLTTLILEGKLGHLFVTNNWSSPLPSIQVLKIDYPENHNIFKWPFTIAEKTPHVKHLYLSGININIISTIQNLKNLEHLEVSSCFLHMDDFEVQWSLLYLPKLHRLVMAQNELTSFGQLSLHITAPMVGYIDLSDNQISILDNNLLLLLPNLWGLVLNNNRIVSLNGIHYLTSLKQLHIAQNYINEVPSDFFKSDFSMLVDLDLSGNPFICGCQIEPFRKWILSDDLVLLKPHLMYRCNAPVSQRGLSVTQINLDCSTHRGLYIGIGISLSLTVTVIVALLIKYRWHLRYGLFLLCTFKRRHYQTADNDEEDTRYDAFVSYAHERDEDLNWVINDLRFNLEEGVEPLKLCIGHARDFIPGTPVIEAITEAIHNSRKTIVVLSTGYIESELCYFETQNAWMRLQNEGHDVLILVQLEPIPDEKFPMWLRQLLCKKKVFKWPPDRAGQQLFWRSLREEIRTATLIDRRYDT